MKVKPVSLKLEFDLGDSNHILIFLGDICLFDQIFVDACSKNKIKGELKVLYFKESEERLGELFERCP